MKIIIEKWKLEQIIEDAEANKCSHIIVDADQYFPPKKKRKIIAAPAWYKTEKKWILTEEFFTCEEDAKRETEPFKFIWPAKINSDGIWDLEIEE